MKTYDITGIGNAIVDILAQVEADVIDRAGVAKGSMGLIEQDQSRAIFKYDCRRGSAGAQGRLYWQGSRR